jgi:hypothetical protein
VDSAFNPRPAGAVLRHLPRVLPEGIQGGELRELGDRDGIRMIELVTAAHRGVLLLPGTTPITCSEVTLNGHTRKLRGQGVWSDLISGESQEIDRHPDVDATTVEWAVR